MISPTDMAMAHAAAESLMTSTCTITREGAPATDPGSGRVTFESVTVHAGLPCRVRPMQRPPRPLTVAGAQIDPETFQVSLPFATTGVQRKDRVHIDASPDPALVGRTFTVRFTPAMGDAISARRLLCEET